MLFWPSLVPCEKLTEVHAKGRHEVNEHLRFLSLVGRRIADVGQLLRECETCIVGARDERLKSAPSALTYR
jgi:hypothetical protein